MHWAENWVLLFSPSPVGRGRGEGLNVRRQPELRSVSRSATEGELTPKPGETSLITIRFGQSPKVIAKRRQHQTIVNFVAVLGDNSSHEPPELSARLIA